jgi:hypothetical protein
MVISDEGAICSTTGLTQNNFLPSIIYQSPEDMMVSIASSIHDNHKRGPVGDFLKEKIQKDAELSIVSAYFTIYAFEALKDQLLDIHHLNFLFGEPGFIRSLEPDKTVKKFFRIVDEHLELAKRLKKKQVAKECADWIRTRVNMWWKSNRQSNSVNTLLSSINIQKFMEFPRLKQICKSILEFPLLLCIK